jgi:chemosensory pili system protein ChpB (putative protein-glutamate methylesterase)
MSSEQNVIIIADDVLQRHRLQQALDKYGVSIVFIGDPARFAGEAAIPDAALCLVELTDEEEYPDLIEALLNRDDWTVLFGPGAAPVPGRQEYIRWERRLFVKLEGQLGSLEALENEDTLEALADAGADSENLSLPQWITPVSQPRPVEQIWILGASLGGPAAIKEFLDALPPGLPVGFVYAQHIDARFSEVLGRVLTRDAHYNLVPAEENRTLYTGEVLQVPVDREIWLDDQARVQFRDDPWPGPYGPSIDQVMLNLSRTYRDRCHAIVFSGMGNDGALGAPAMKQAGSHIWIQTPESCASGAMPESVQATDSAGFEGTPRELAAQLLRTMEEQFLLGKQSQCNSA